MCACRSNHAAEKQIKIFNAAFVAWFVLLCCCVKMLFCNNWKACGFTRVQKVFFSWNLFAIYGVTTWLQFFYVLFPPLCAYYRYQATHYEWAYAPTPSGGIAGWAWLHCGDAHFERCSNCGLLWCTVHAGNPREGNMLTHTCTHTHTQTNTHVCVST